MSSQPIVLISHLGQKDHAKRRNEYTPVLSLSFQADSSSYVFWVRLSEVQDGRVGVCWGSEINDTNLCDGRYTLRDSSLGAQLTT